MGTDGKMDKFGGKVKETAGEMTGNEEMEAEGRKDQAKGEVKESVDKVGDKIKDVVD
ncbi:MAG: CsbD family protein [Dehalococcoidia bacterium]|nr:CsbD family protein [Dehalococcoidia bacterium]